MKATLSLESKPHAMHRGRPFQSGEKLALRAARIARIGYWDADFDGNLLAVEGEYLAILGYPADTVLTKQADFNLNIHPEDRLRVESLFAQADATQQDYLVEYRIIQPGGNVVYLREIGEVIFNPDGKPIGHSGTIHDITRESLAEEKLRNALAMAEESLLAKNRFLGNMSHELRTPLNAIKGYAEMLAAGFHPTRSQDYLGMIVNASDHLTSIISDILTISEVEQSDHILAQESIQAQAVIDQAVDLSGLLLDQSAPPLRKNCHCDDEGLTLETDPRLLVQILVNLLSNARKYAPQSREIIISYHSDTDGIVFEVRDFGPGIPKEELALIVEPFTRGKAANRSAVPGTGLGLTLTRGLAERLGGSLALTIPDDGGLAARVTLPLLT